MFITTETDRSLPGIGEAEITTVSPGLTLTVLCSPRAMRARDADSSPCEPVDSTTTLLSGSLLAASARMMSLGGIFKMPREKAISTLDTMLRPVTTTLRSYLAALLNTCWMRLMRVEKVAKIMRPSASRNTRSMVSPRSFSDVL